MISCTVCFPSQRSIISRLGPFNRKARSGMCRTRNGWFFSLRRQPRARHGRLWRSGIIASPSLRGWRWFEGARRRPAGVYVGEVEGVKLCPENVTFGAQGGVGLVLFLARASVFHNPGKSEVGIFGRLREAAGEIIEAAREPGIVSAEGFDAKGNELA